MGNKMLLTKDLILNKKYGVGFSLAKLIAIPVVGCLALTSFNRGKSGMLIVGILIASLLVSAVAIMIKKVKKEKQMTEGTNDFVIKVERLESKSRTSIFSSKKYYFDFNFGRADVDLHTYTYSRVGDMFYLIINPNKEKVTAVFSANEYSLSDDLKHLLIEDNNDPTQFNVN